MSIKNCKNCESSFLISSEDKAFYDRVSPIFNGKKYPIPEPTLCPDCRSQRRLVWRPELHLFKRKSDFSGKQMLSMYPPESKFKVYSHEEWWSDKWDPFEYGRDFDFSRPFFEQFAELMRDTPMVSLFVGGNENSDYINSASWNKNCYLIAAANYNEDCYYGNFLNHCKMCLDSSFLTDSEFCYECTDCSKCYNLKYSANCYNCSDSYFLYNCRNTRNCFGSVNLVNKEYVFMNEQLTREDYEKRLAKLELHRRSRIAEAMRFFEKHRLKYPHKYMIGEMNENVTGNAVSQCRNTLESFDVSNLEDCKYCSWFHNSKNCMDIYAWGFPGSAECYECLEAGDTAFHVLFSVSTYNGTDMMYSYGTRACRDVFGCVSLRHKQYCIFNKQYSKEEYEKLIPKIIEHMIKTGEWGEFFPMSVSPFAYNQTIAQDYFPIDKEKSKRLGAEWSGQPLSQNSGEKYNVPDSIRDVNENICEKILVCEKTKKPYKIIQQEYQFYKENNIPIPIYSFEARHQNRLHRRNPHKLWDRECMKCGRPIRTSYAPDRSEMVYCEKCYLSAVY